MHDVVDPFEPIHVPTSVDNRTYEACDFCEGTGFRLTRFYNRIRCLHCNGSGGGNKRPKDKE